jgi:hypothetical protein
MTSLLDIAPSGRQITIRDKTLTIKGISAQGVVYLLNRFPLVRQIMTGHQIEGLSVETFMVLAPDAVNAAIACGFGYVGTNLEEQEKAEEIAASFSIDEQVHALTEIMEVTLPRGIGPFVDMINGLTKKAEELGKAAAMRLGAQSSGASPTGTASTAPGDTRPGN